MSFVYNEGQSPGASSASGIKTATADVNKAAQDQLRWNRPNTSNPWAEQYSMKDGSIHQGFTGPMRGAQGSLMGQALRNMGNPMDFNEYNAGTGDQHRTDAIGAASGQMGDWFGGMQGQLNGATEQNLQNQGYTAGSPGYDAAKALDTGWGNDMQSSINNAAIGLGTQGGAMRQSQDMQTQQQRLAEALRERSMPMDQLAAMQKLGKQPGAEADDSIMNGATMDLDARYKNYMGKRGEYEKKNAEDMAAGAGLGADLFNTALTFGGGATGGGGGLLNKAAGYFSKGKGPRSI